MINFMPGVGVRQGDEQMEGDWIGWRGGILILLGLAVAYLFFTLFRLLRVGRGVSSDRGLPATSPSRPEPDLGATVHPTTDNSPLRATQQKAPWSGEMDLDLSDAASEAMADTGQPVAPSRPSGFGAQLAEHLARSELEQEVRQLRQDLDALRAELDELKAARNISPHYAEALTLARQGFGVQGIADRMGISLAEAELVQSLSRGEIHFEEGGHHDGDREGRDGLDDRYELDLDLGFESRRNKA